jgi:hypothetical protein
MQALTGGGRPIKKAAAQLKTTKSSPKKASQKTIKTTPKTPAKKKTGVNTPTAPVAKKPPSAAAKKKKNKAPK